MINLFGKGDRRVPQRRVHARGELFRFTLSFGPQKNPTVEPRKWPEFEWATDDAYEFFLKHGTFGDLEQFFTPGQSWQWDDQVQHDTYERLLESAPTSRRTSRNIHCAVLTVGGGWFDAEDLQGPFSRVPRHRRI